MTSDIWELQRILNSIDFLIKPAFLLLNVTWFC
jgi:hypothetical protein